MIDGDATEFIRQLVVFPTCTDLFGHEPMLQELIAIVKKYPVFEWLSYLARIQQMLDAGKVADEERMQRVICGTMPHTLRRPLMEFKQRLRAEQRMTLYYERQLATLQELAILYAPEPPQAFLNATRGGMI